MRLQYDPTRRRWHERIVRYHRMQATWVPWHWVYITGGGGMPAIWRRWFGLGR